MNRWRKRASVCGPRLVEVEVRQERTGRDLVRKQVVKHQDVRLLQHLGARGPFGTEEQVGGDRSPGSDLLDYEGLEIRKPANCS